MIKQNNLKQIVHSKIKSNHVNNLGATLMHMLCDIADYLVRSFDLNQIICNIKTGLHREEKEKTGLIFPIECYIFCNSEKITLKNSMSFCLFLEKWLTVIKKICPND